MAPEEKGRRMDQTQEADLKVNAETVVAMYQERVIQLEHELIMLKAALAQAQEASQD